MSNTKVKFKIGDRVIYTHPSKEEEERGEIIFNEGMDKDSLKFYRVKLSKPRISESKVQLLKTSLVLMDEQNLRLDTQYYRELRLKELLDK